MRPRVAVGSTPPDEPGSAPRQPERRPRSAAKRRSAPVNQGSDRRGAAGGRRRLGHGRELSSRPRSVTRPVFQGSSSQQPTVGDDGGRHPPDPRLGDGSPDRTTSAAGRPGLDQAGAPRIPGRGPSPRSPRAARPAGPAPCRPADRARAGRRRGGFRRCPDRCRSATPRRPGAARRHWRRRPDRPRRRRTSAGSTRRSPPRSPIASTSSSDSSSVGVWASSSTPASRPAGPCRPVARARPPPGRRRGPHRRSPEHRGFEHRPAGVARLERDLDHVDAVGGQSLHDWRAGPASRRTRRTVAPPGSARIAARRRQDRPGDRDHRPVAGGGRARCASAGQRPRRAEITHPDQSGRRHSSTSPKPRWTWASTMPGPIQASGPPMTGSCAGTGYGPNGPT